MRLERQGSYMKASAGTGVFISALGQAQRTLDPWICSYTDPRFTDIHTT